MDERDLAAVDESMGRAFYVDVVGLEARVRELESALSRAEYEQAMAQQYHPLLERHEGLVERLRAMADEWERDSRRLNTVPTLPASTLMDCASEVRELLADKEPEKG